MKGKGLPRKEAIEAEALHLNEAALKDYSWLALAYPILSRMEEQ